MKLSTEGTKPLLVQRLSNAIEKNQPNTEGVSPKVMNINEDVKRVISLRGHRNLFYFHERFKHSANIADRFTLKTGFLPDTIERTGGRASKNKIVYIRNVKDIIDAITDFMENPSENQKIEFKKEHLTVWIENNDDFQIKIYIHKTPTSNASYTLSLKSPKPYSYGVTKKVIFNDITFNRNNPTDEDLVDTMNALPDLLLGVQWVNLYLLQEKGSLVKDVEPDFKITSESFDYLNIQPKKHHIIKKYILKKLKEFFKK